MGKKSRKVKASKQSPPPAEAPPSEPSQRERVQVQREDFVDISQYTDANFEKLVDDGDNVWVGRYKAYVQQARVRVFVFRPVDRAREVVVRELRDVRGFVRRE